MIETLNSSRLPCVLLEIQPYTRTYCQILKSHYYLLNFHHFSHTLTHTYAHSLAHYAYRYTDIHVLGRSTYKFTRNSCFFSYVFLSKLFKIFFFCFFVFYFLVGLLICKAIHIECHG